MREIPKKNYIIMIIIIIGIVISTILLANYYNNHFKKTSIMYNYLSEIKKKDLNTYLIENPNIILYISNKYDTKNLEIEEKLKQEIINNNLDNYFVYINLNDNNLDFIDNINNKYNGNIDKKIPLLAVFENRKIKEVYYDLKNINIVEIIGDMN